ncbi:hypothetical protein F5B21DRAFT_455573 [Xylaria acuta]|nr:hypothetical protein F5B21DRAFT_455573 [Xylaria acuta]
MVGRNTYIVYSTVFSLHFIVSISMRNSFSSISNFIAAALMTSYLGGWHDRLGVSLVKTASNDGWQFLKGGRFTLGGNG